MATMSQPTLGPLALGDQLAADSQRRVVERVTIVGLVAENVASASFYRENQSRRRFGFGHIQGSNFPRDGNPSSVVDGVQLISFRPAAAGTPPCRIGIFAVASDHQRLAVDTHHPGGNVEFS